MNGTTRKEHHDEATSERVSLVNAGSGDDGGDDNDDNDDVAISFNSSSRASHARGTAADAAERFGPPVSFAVATEQRRRNNVVVQSLETEPAPYDSADRRRSPPSFGIQRGSKSLLSRELVLVVCGLLLLGGLFVLMEDRTTSDDGSAGTAASGSDFVPYDYDPVSSLYYTNDGSPILEENGETTVVYTPPEIRRRFDAAKQALMDTLEDQYGSSYVQSVFNNMTALISPPTSASGNVGWERMKRKLQIKLLAVQLRANAGTSAKNDAKMEPFVWATGGHSAAAGHGNLFNESYTAVLERTVQGAFSAAGIRFRARNYAMGGTSSGPQVALCQPQIFGNDVDVLSWDYGMTDGRTPSLLELYCGRAALQPTRPACVGIELHGGGGTERIDVLGHLEASGMTVVYLDEAVKSAALRAVPDCDRIPLQQVSELPRYIRHFKCDGVIEKGHPYCEVNKWTNLTGYCPTKPKFRTGWHPGWKWHALIGRLLGLSVLQMMDEALSLVEELKATDYQAQHDGLVAQESADYDKFRQSELSQQWSDFWDSQSQDGDLALRALFRDRSMCHTAFLPAESRYRGIMVMNGSVGGPTNYYKGISSEQVENDTIRGNDSSTPRLVYDSSDRQDCDVLEVDHKDYYFLTAAEGWKRWVLPNRAELFVYGTESEGEALKGLVAMSLHPCSWGRRCKAGDVRQDGVQLGHLEVQVNGVAVTQLTEVKDVRFLKHAGGHVFPHNGTGQFEIRARVTLQGGYFRPTSFIFL